MKPFGKPLHTVDGDRVILEETPTERYYTQNVKYIVCTSDKNTQRASIVMTEISSTCELTEIHYTH